VLESQEIPHPPLHFMKPEVLLPRSQKSTTSPHLQPDELNPTPSHPLSLR